MDEAGSLAAVKQKLLTNYTQSLEKTVQSLTPQLMDRVVALILKANRIYFFSHGGSRASAQLLYGDIPVGNGRVSAETRGYCDRHLIIR